MPAYQLACNDRAFKPIELGESSVAIGRHPDNDISIKDDDVASRFHCVIEPAPGGGYLIKDLGSRNGTRVNGTPVSQSPLTSGDVITVGKHTFSVSVIEQPADDAAASLLRADRRSDGGAPRRPGDNVAWATELRAIIDSLPPKSSQLESIMLIDASGAKSDVLSADGPGPTAARLLLLTASKARASDIHCEPKDTSTSVRMRADGQMVFIIDLPRNAGEALAGLIKAGCQMQQAARDAIQEGHFSVRFLDRRVDYRVSFTPTIHGQKLVLRVLDSRSAPQSLADLGLPIYMLDRLRRSLEQDSGMVLAAGPTGCGKTTTLYNALRDIDRKRRNVITIEDPVEYSLEGVTQIPVGHAGSFGDLLRSILRQDPDVILVGEIRDEETARTAMQAAMTGHLVFSTIHAKDTIGSVFRLLDLGIEPYLVANSLDLIVAQRLVRLLCEFCKRPVKVTPGQSTRIGRFLDGKSELFAATGCAKCLRTGFNGRRAIFELLDFQGTELRDAVLTKPTIQAIKRIVEQGVFTSLQQSGWLLAAKGLTTLDEVDRVAGM